MSTDPNYLKAAKEKILAYRTALRCDGCTVPYTNTGTVDAKTTQAIKLVEQARDILQLAADEIGRP